MPAQPAEITGLAAPFLQIPDVWASENCDCDRITARNADAPSWYDTCSTQAVRWRIGIGVLAAVAACGSAPAPSPDPTYLTDRAFRRSELEASLVNPSNGYSQLRLARYATQSGGWDALAEANPACEPVLATGGDPTAPLSPAAAPLALDVDPEDDDALRALGEAAFFGYPAQLMPAAQAVSTAGYGVWTDPVRGVGGFQRVALPTGGVGLAATCATCHAALRDGVLVAGIANERLDLGRMFVDAGLPAAAAVPAYDAWGPGRLDVTTAAGGEPVRIPDLRATKWLTYLQADGTVQQRDLTTLAIRIETLIITAHDETVRPPRIVALALATYLWSLADALPPAPAASARGADVFARACAGCHAPPALTGDPIPLAEIGTDPALGHSPQRGTGAYRVPSLHGVAARGLLLHDGAVRSLAALFDPARLTAGYAGGVRPGPVPGHVYGLELDDTERVELLAYLTNL